RLEGLADLEAQLLDAERLEPEEARDLRTLVLHQTGRHLDGDALQVNAADVALGHVEVEVRRADVEPAGVERLHVEAADDQLVELSGRLEIVVEVLLELDGSG